MLRDRRPRPHRDQFEKSTRKLHDPVLGTPGVAVARADLKAKPVIKCSCRIKIAEGQHEMVEGTGQKHGSPDKEKRGIGPARTGPALSPKAEPAIRQSVGAGGYSRKGSRAWRWLDAPSRVNQRADCFSHGFGRSLFGRRT